MRWDYIFFILFLYPVLKGLFLYVAGKAEEERNKRHEKEKSLTQEQLLINTSSRTLLAVIPYFGAYYYADFQYVWLTLGSVYLLTSGMTLASALVSQSVRNNDPEMYEEVQMKSKKELRDVYFWPKWQVHALCAFNVSVLTLWLYSWRYLFA